MEARSIRTYSDLLSALANDVEKMDVSRALESTMDYGELHGLARDYGYVVWDFSNWPCYTLTRYRPVFSEE